MNGLRLYFRLITFSLRAQMTYRMSFVLQTFAHFFTTFVEFAALWALLNRFGNIAGWKLPEVCLCYGVMNVTFAIADAFTRGFDQFAGMVKEGEFDRVLLRPRSTVLQLLGQELTLRRIGRFTQGALVLGIGLAGLPGIATPLNFLLLAWAVMGGVLMFAGILVVQATVCFWTTESIEMMNVFSYGSITAGQYPLTIYPAWLQRFFILVVPLACVAFFPVAGVLGRAEEFGLASWQVWMTPAMGGLFLVAALCLWSFGVRRYCSTGT